MKFLAVIAAAAALRLGGCSSSCTGTTPNCNTSATSGTACGSASNCVCAAWAWSALTSVVIGRVSLRNQLNLVWALLKVYLFDYLRKLVNITKQSCPFQNNTAFANTSLRGQTFSSIFFFRNIFRSTPCSSFMKKCSRMINMACRHAGPDSSSPSEY